MTSLRVSRTATTAAALLTWVPGVANSQADTPLPAAACVAVVLPSVQGVEGSAADVASALRDRFVSYLWHVPYGAVVGSAVAAGAAQAISSFASETARKNEIELSYRLGMPASAEQAKRATAKAKAKVDREIC